MLHLLHLGKMKCNAVTQKISCFEQSSKDMVKMLFWIVCMWSFNQSMLQISLRIQEIASAFEKEEKKIIQHVSFKFDFKLLLRKCTAEPTNISFGKGRTTPILPHLFFWHHTDKLQQASKKLTPGANYPAEVCSCWKQQLSLVSRVKQRLHNFPLKNIWFTFPFWSRSCLTRLKTTYYVPLHLDLWYHQFSREPVSH